MTVQHYSVVANDSWYAIARKLSPKATNAQIDQLVAYLTVANGLTLNTTLFVGRILHYDDVKLPIISDTTPTPIPNPTPTPVPPGQFYIKNGLIGRDGKRWVPIGLNGATKPASAPSGDWWNDRGMGIMNGHSKLFQDLGFNFVRFNEMRDYNAYSFEDYQNGLFQAMDEYLERGITVMPAYHSMGPGSNPTPVRMSGDINFVRFWREIINRYKNNPNVIVNPLNEPIGTAWDSWEALAQAQYDLMRSLGWAGLIVIDLPQWAQGIDYATNRAPGWIKARTDGKVVLGFHNYAMGNQTTAVRAAQQAGAPIIMGECGATLSEGTTPSFDWSVANADSLGIGCVFWWGAGNRNDSYVLRNRVGSTFYDTTLGLSVAGQKMFDLAKVRPTQPSL